ncbi:ferric reductase-like transmembrane domain-containing protein [Streptomyces sp. NPDC018693]|uniref:ferric reductase-like transmembrane domain-containing protein n=1 Tax=unclassified Streptomyces TaxID=2593676 RepID=UPI00378E8EF2
MDDAFLEFLNFGAGVLSLVCLTCSVIWGLVAQDRMILSTRQRITGQAVHRVTAVASIAFLLVHIVTKLALEHTSWIAAVIPFGLLLSDDDKFTGTAFLVGLGTLAGMLMIFVGITGALRNRFASPAPVAARWRAMHMLAYPAWCAALIHGLYAGRPAKTFFMVSYELCVVAVAAALALRGAPRPLKRKLAVRIARMIGNDEPAGREELETSRARATDPAVSDLERKWSARGDSTGPLPRVTPASADPLYQAPSASAQESTSGFSAAYRAVSGSSQGQRRLADQTSRLDLPLDTQPTEVFPRFDDTSSTSGSWPIPSPPPVGEAPPSAYDPLIDTGYNIPVYGNSGDSAISGYSPSDVYDTTETNTVPGTYNQNDTYNSGPANEPSPGASFDTPGSGEPWNTPSGGYR